MKQIYKTKAQLSDELEEAISRIREFEKSEIMQRERNNLEPGPDVYKNKLLSLSLQISEKYEYLKKIKLKLEKLPFCADQIQEIINDLNNELNSEKFWKIFDMLKVVMDNNVKNKLNDLFPDLSSAEVRICQLIRIGLTNKEIATILSLSVRTIETHRFNIRRKFELKSNKNLNQFLTSM